MPDRKLKLEIEVDDKGSVHVKRFADKTERELKNVGRAVDTVDKKNKASIDTWKKLAVTAAGFFAVLGAGRAVRGFMETASSFENMQAKLDAITKGKGVETLEAINQWALKMPVNTKEAIDAFTMMAAMGLQPNIEKMQTLVDVASVMGDETLPRVARALGQIQTLGKLSAEELNQLAESGINARKYLKEAFGGKTVEEIQKSEIAIADVVKAIWDGLEREFKGSSKRRMETWSGMVVAMESTWTEFKRHVMASGPFEVMKKQLKDFLDYLATNEGQMDLAKWADQTARSVLSAFEAMSYGAQGFLGALSVLQQIFYSIKIAWTKLQTMDIESTMGLYDAKHPRKGIKDLFRKDESKLQGKIMPPGLQDGLKKDLEDIEKWKESGIAAQDMYNNAKAATEGIRKLIEGMKNAPPRSKVFGGGSDINDLFGGDKNGSGGKSSQNQFLKEVETIKAGLMQEVIDMGAESNQEQAKAVRTMTDGWKAGVDEWLEHSRTGFEQMQDLAFDTANAMHDAFSDFFFDAFTGELKTLNDYLQVFLKGIARSVSNVFAEMAAQGIMGMFKSGGVTPAIEAGGGALTGGYTPTRAFGGPVSAGVGYLIGERGPELFLPRQSGTIIPNNQVQGAAPKLVVNITNKSGAPAAVNQQNTRFNGREWVVDVVLDAALNNRRGAGVLLGRT